MDGDEGTMMDVGDEMTGGMIKMLTIVCSKVLPDSELKVLLLLRDLINDHAGIEVVASMAGVRLGGWTVEKRNQSRYFNVGCGSR